MYISVVLTWILFLAMFPLAFFWLRCAWRIIWLKDFSQVALRGGNPPENATKFAPYAAIINLVAGGIMTILILLIVAGGLAYAKWTAVAGSTIWLKLVADFLLSRHAHTDRRGK